MYLINEALPVGFRSCKEKGKSGEGAGRGFPLLFTVRREESGWCLQQIKETRIIKRPQSPFIFLLFFPLISFVAAVLSACLFPPSWRGREHQGPGWGSSLCCWSGCDIARCGDNCASYCLASAGDDQLQMKTMTMGIPFVFPGLHAAEVATISSLPSSAGGI